MTRHPETVTGFDTKPRAALIACPYCDGSLTILINLVPDEACGMRLSDPRIVIDRHLDESPDCELRRFA